jgi:hypothetical protein
MLAIACWRLHAGDRMLAIACWSRARSNARRAIALPEADTVFAASVAENDGRSMVALIFAPQAADHARGAAPRPAR